MSAARSLPPTPRRLSQRALTIVPKADDTTGVAAANARIEVAVCCAQADLAAVGRVFEALERFDCKPLALPGVQRDPTRMTVSVEAARHPRLYVVCKTARMDLPAVRRMVRAFSSAKGRERHQLLVIEVDTERVYAAVPKIRRGADTLRRRLAEPETTSRSNVGVDLPLAIANMPGPSESAVGRRRPNVDTTYAHYRGGASGQALERTVIEPGGMRYRI